MRDQKQTSVGSVIQRCHCVTVWPFQWERLVGAGGPHAASEDFVWPKKRQILLWQARAEEFTTTVKPRAPGTSLTAPQPCDCNRADDLCGVIMTTFQISKVTSFTSLCFPGPSRSYRVSPLSALWFISRHTGMQRWLCFVVICDSSFHQGGKGPRHFNEL